jgi:protein-S-isoprenylcysteine O-methyltransferase Ste14
MSIPHITHYLGRFFRFEASIQEDHQLVTEGPYSIVRHPSYTGLLFTHSEWFLWHFGPVSWVRASGLWSTVVGKLAVFSFAGVVILGTLYRTLSRWQRRIRHFRRGFVRNGTNGRVE